jgi:xylulose-5-phosphate/fructose-6-phosphate phosphoketolase
MKTSLGRRRLAKFSLRKLKLIPRAADALGTWTALERYQRAVHYLAAAQIYLKANVLLEKRLQSEHIKDRLLGHWGTAPGINFIYSHLNRLILKTDASILLVTGPGHGAAANLANMFLEGTLAEFFPELSVDRGGLEELIKRFCWPGGFASHLNPGLPGVIHEGGELGYALATAAGAALDNPNLICACIVGDGEAETGPTAAAWNSNKFLSPATDGAILPILHLNGFKISNPTICGTMNDAEIKSFFVGHGYAPRIVPQSERINAEMEAALDWAFERIRKLQSAARVGKPPLRPPWPVLVLRTEKGWTGPHEIDGKILEGSFRSHQVPGKDLKTNAAHLRIIERWLQSYRPDELFPGGRPAEDILALCPRGKRRMAMNPHSFGGRIRKVLDLPSPDEHALAIENRGAKKSGAVDALGKYLTDVIRRNEAARNFRIFCPDELESNHLGEVLSATDRQYNWPLPPEAEHTSRGGRVIEVLSEHNCQGWLQGYLLTGRHGLFPCYEAFLPIVDGMMNQYAKFLKISRETPWRDPVSSLNYLLTSESWRQDHNGYSHQGPGFINNLLTKKGVTYRIYLPPDANCLLSTMDHCLRSTNYINLVIAGKNPMPQWLPMDEAIEHCRIGASVWPWASVNDGHGPEVILAGCGDNLTLEVMAAAKILRDEAPDWKVRVVNVTDLMVLGIPEKYPHGLREEKFEEIFPLNCPVIFNFHGYTAAIKQLLWERQNNHRFDVNGYREEGTTTTPFDMQVRNRTSRFHLVVQAVKVIAQHDPRRLAHAQRLGQKYEEKLREHDDYIRATSVDLPEIANWKWK